MLTSQVKASVRGQEIQLQADTGLWSLSLLLTHTHTHKQDNFQQTFLRFFGESTSKKYDTNVHACDLGWNAPTDPALLAHQGLQSAPLTTCHLSDSTVFGWKYLIMHQRKHCNYSKKSLHGQLPPCLFTLPPPSVARRSETLKQCPTADSPTNLSVFEEANMLQQSARREEDN